MATDNTINQTEAANNASAIHESDVEQAHLTQSGSPVQVQVPQGENVVRVQVTPGETVELPFPADGLVARLGDNGNLAVKVGDVTVILVGYADAVGQGEVNIVGNDGKPVDVAAVLAATDPNLDIQTAAGPGAGDQGAGPDNNGGLFSPFDPQAGIGGLNAIGGLDPTALNYNLIQRQFVEIIEADEVDTDPVLIGITGIRVVNEDDFGHSPNVEQPSEEAFSARQSFIGGGGGDDDFPVNGWSIIDRLGDTELPNAYCADFGKHRDGNDPFDNKDHEEGSQSGGVYDNDPAEDSDATGDNIDKDREPLSVTVKIEANFFGDLPGKVTFDADGDGIDTGDTPIIQALEAKGLTSHGHELAYILLKEVPESAPGANDGHGQMVVAYYLEDACNCYGGEQSLYEGKGEGGKVPVIVFTISVDDDAANADELNVNGNSEIPMTFTIYGVVDHPTKGSGVGGEDILDIETPFYLHDTDSSTAVPGTELVFRDVDDVPQLGCVKYGCWNDIPYAIVDANLTIGHDETPGDQSTWYDSDLQPHAPGWLPDQVTDDVDGCLGDYLVWKADNQLDGIAGGESSGEDSSITYQQSVLSQLSSQFLSHGNFHADALGVAKTYIDVSFGADGKAKGNDQAGDTKFQHDNDAGTGNDNSDFNYDSNGNLLDNDDGGTDKRAFELFMKDNAGDEGVIDSSKTNWTITVMVDGEPVVISVYAFQLDANTIIGMADPTPLGGGGGNDESVETAIAVDENGNHCLTGTGDSIPVFLLRLDPDTGQVTFVQYHQVNNPEGGNAAWPDWDQSSNDPIHLYDADGKPLVFFEATDFDGDTVQAQLEVSVIDDAPDAKDDKAVLDEENAGAGGYNTVTGNLVLGISNDDINNDNGKDRLSVDHDHTIPALKYGNSTISFDFATDGVTVTGSDATNVTFDGHTVEFDTPHGHFKVVVDATQPDPDAGDSSTDSSQLGYYEYTSNPGNNSDKDYYGVPKDADGTVFPTGANDSQKVSFLLNSFGALTLSNNLGGNDWNPNTWSYKNITAGGKTYSGLAVGGGIDGGETDTNGSGQVAEEKITIRFPHDVDAAKITVGALFDGQLYDSGNAEALKWEAWDGNTKVGEGVIYGDYDGLVDFFINVGHDFDKVTLTPLDNGAGNNGNNTDFLLVGVTTCDELCITEELKYVLKDSDGDYDTAKLTLEVQDGEPKITSCEVDLNITVDEDGLPGGNNPDVNNASGDWADNVGGDNGPGDADNNESTAQGHVSYNLYADGLGAVYLSSNSNLTTLDGKSITWAWDAEGNRLVGYATPDTDRIVVEVLLSNANDAGVDFKVVLHEPLDHPQNSYEDNLYLDIKVTVADKDCDIDTATIHVKIDDDVPTITPTTCSNLVLNGSFEDLGSEDNGQLENGNWGVFSQIPGWRSGEYDDQHNIPNGGDYAGLEIQAGAVVPASDGNNVLELDSDALEPGQQAPNNTNTYVYQNVQGTEDNASYLLKFDYQPRVTGNPTNTNDVEVWWGGQKIATISGSTPGWQTYQFVVSGDAGSTRLEFRAAGTDEKLGGFIDNVWVSSCEIIDEDDLGDGSDPFPKDNLTVHGSTGVSFGADGPGGFSGLSLTQPLKSHGVAISIVAGPDGTFYGMAGATKVFTVEFTKSGGEFDGNYKFTLNNEIDHPGGNNGENLYDLGINFTAKDADGDGVNGTLHVTIVDDVPTADISDRDNHNEGGDSVRIDESAGNQDDDKSNAPGNAIYDALKAAGNNAAVLAWGTGSSASVFTNVDYNADQPGTSVLTLHASNQGVDSGLNVLVNGVSYNVDLYDAGNGIVVGKVDGGPLNGQVAIAVSIGQDGKLSVAEFIALQHPQGGSNHDDTVSIVDSALIAKLTVTDFDGDVATDTVAVGSQVQFDDDGPRIDTSSNAIVDEDEIPLAGGNPGGSGDVNASNVANGNLHIDFGTDGPGSIEITLNGAAPRLTGNGAFLQFVQVGDTLIGHTGNQNDPALTVKVNNDGTYAVTLLKPLDHSDGSAENDIDLQFKVKVTDEDGDTATATIFVKIDDDSITANDDGVLAIAALNVQTVGTLLLANDVIGADKPGSVVGIKLGGEGGSYDAVNGSKDIYLDSNGNVQATDVNAMGKLHINADGSWNFTQYKSSALPDITFSYKAEDADRDSDTASFKIDLKLEQKPRFDTAQVLVDEDGLTGGTVDDPTAPNSDTQPGDDIGGQGPANTEKVFEGSFNLAGQGVTEVSLVNNLFDYTKWAGIQTVEGNAINAMSWNSATHTFIAYSGSDEVIKVEITDVATGAYKVTLLHALKHGDGSTEDNLTFTLQVDATNADGTTTGDMVVNVDDDRPYATNDGQLASLDDNAAGVVIGTLAGILANDGFGADGAATSGSVVIGVGSLGGTVVIDGGNLKYTSAYNVAPGAQATETFTYTIKDKDGDTTTATFTVKLTDTKPTIVVDYGIGNTAGYGIVDEDELPAGKHDNAPGDDAGLTTFTGNYNADFFADTQGTVSFNVAEGADSGIDTLAGVNILWHVVSATEIVGYRAGGNPALAADQYFKMTLSGPNPSANGDGTWTFTLLQSVKHLNSATEDNLPLSVQIVAKDVENDVSLPATINVQIDDDAPDAVNDSGAVVTFGVTINGNVTDNDSSGADVDGGFPKGKVDSFSIDGVNFLPANGSPQNVPGFGSITMSSSGAYTFTQTSGSAGSFDIKYKLVDADGDSDVATLHITTKDQPIQNFIVVGENVNDDSNQTTDHRLDNSPNQPDGPIDGAAGNDVLIGDVGGKQTIVQPGTDYSIALICDTSSSMSTNNRIGLMRDAVTNFVNSLLPHNGTINITLITFGSFATTEISISGLTAGNLPGLLTQISQMQAGDNAVNGTAFTNYEGAILTARNYMDAQPAGSTKLAYFMTDGTPTAYNADQNGDNDANTDLAEINPALTAVNPWMVANPPVQLFGIGIGNGADLDILRYFDNTNLQAGTVKTNVDNGSVTDNYGQPITINTADELTSALTGGGSTTTVNPVGNDLINGNAGNDAILGDSIYHGSQDAGWASYVAAHAGWTPEQIRADIYDNLTTGDHSYAGEGTKGGDDIINAGAGDDYVYGQAGNDTIHGDADNDYIEGGSGNDTLFGDAGNDTLIGGAGTDTLNGGAGNDTLTWDANDTFNGGADFDKVVVGGAGTTVNYDPAKFDSIEMIDLGNSNHNQGRTLQLSIDDVITDDASTTTGFTHAGFAIDMLVVGDNGSGTVDTVNLDDAGSGSWSQVGTGIVLGSYGTFNIWRNDSGNDEAVVAIEQGINVI